MLYIYLLGHLRVFYGKQSIEFHARPKTLALWAFLLLKRASPTPRDSLAFTLWPDASESAARADLRRHLHELERALPQPPDEQVWLLRRGDTLQWNPASAYWLDVAEFERLSALPDYLEKAAALYTDDLLISLYDDWLDEERTHLRALYFNVMRQLIARQQAAGDVEQARRTAEQAFRRDPLDEPLAQILMRLQYLANDRAGALKTYEQFQMRLSEDLAANPSQETKALYETIIAEQPLGVEPEPAVAIVASKHNLPAALTSFFGREEELGELHQMLIAPTSPQRLITLAGPPGTGKTRLALETGRRLLNRQTSLFPDGIYFVDLSAISDQALVIPAVATVLGLKEDPTTPLIEQIKEFLKAKYLLLILDNFEQVMEAAEVVAGLLAAAPGLWTLVTSREPLKLYGEYEFPVFPLPYPEVGHLPIPAALRDYAAVALFEARARLRQHRFAITEINAAEVAGVCQQVDGIPLAVELAAGQLRDLAVGEVLVQLREKRLSLNSDLRDLPARHQTLRTAIEWSYALLSAEERHLLQQVSIFAGGWTLEAAEAVCDPLADRPLSERLTALADKNLIYEDAREGGTRWAMLATIREFALLRLEDAPDAAAVRLRHARYFTEFAERIVDRWYGPEKAALVQLAMSEEDNFQSALSWTLLRNGKDTDDEIVNLGARLSHRNSYIWKMKGRFQEVEKWHKAALVHRGRLPFALQSSILNSLGGRYIAASDLPSARGYCEEALFLARQAEDELLISNALNNLGIISAMQGQFEEAKEFFAEVISLARVLEGQVKQSELSDLLSGSYNNLALTLKYLGRVEEAAALFEDALAYDRQYGDLKGIGSRLHNIGNLYVELKKVTEAIPYFRESLEIAYSLDSKQEILSNFASFAEASLLLGHYGRSSRLYGFFEAMGREFGIGLSKKDTDIITTHMAQLRERLGSMRLEALLVEGEAMTLEQAVAYALESA